MEDDDWDVYRGINKDHADEDEEDTEAAHVIEK